jgi:uncharacterized protein
MRIVILPLTVLILVGTHAFAAGFDCRKASTAIEKMICSDEELSQQDEQLAELYAKSLAVVSYKDDLQRQQRHWINKERNTCKDKDCLRLEYSSRIGILENTYAAAKIVRTQSSGIKDKDIVVSAARKMRLQNMVPGETYSKKELAERKFCSAFLKDLQEEKNVEFVEPIVTTDDYNDPKLQKYLGRCPDLKPYETVYWLPHIMRFLEENNIPRSEWEESGSRSYSTRDYKLYQVDSHRNNKKRTTYVFSGECDGGDIKILDLKQCKIFDSIQVNSTIKYYANKWFEDEYRVNENNQCDVNKLTGAKIGALTYKDNFYIYDLSYSNSILYLRKVNKHRLCVFEIPN